ncbi:TIGR00270 family protein [Candidatus Micrarchaeota archaeon]|nr:TIGR00270 family protein [Candidatus Micrarchaeota archaeon]
MPACEICGTSAEELYVVGIEGARMQACAKCKPQGSSVLAVVSAAVQRAPQPAPQPGQLGEVPALVENAGEIVRAARESAGLSQEQLAQKIAEPATFLKKIEGGRAEPTEKAARKLEKVLGITLFKGKGEKPLLPQKPGKKTEPLTLGDVVVLRK